MIELSLSIMLVSAVAQPEVADLLFTDSFEGQLSGAWRAYDNWGKPDFGLVDTSPLGSGGALRIGFDDTSTVSHFDKGAVVNLPQPIPWSLADFMSVRYFVDNKVSNLRIFCHCDKGGWWDYMMPEVAVGQPGMAVARREEFRLAWTDDPAKPAPDKTGSLLAVFVSVHNDKPVNSGERFVLYLDDVQIGTWLLPLRQPVPCEGLELQCWPIAQTNIAPGLGDPNRLARCVAVRCGSSLVWAAAAKGQAWFVGSAEQRDSLTLNGRPLEANWSGKDDAQGFVATVPLSELGQGAPVALELRVGESRWSGRFLVTRALSAAEALALSFRTGAARWAPARERFTADQPLLVDVFLPAPWAKTEFRAQVADTSGNPLTLAETARRAEPGGTAISLSTGHLAALAEPGEYLAELKLRLGADKLSLTCPVRVEELDRAALRVQATRASIRAAELATRVREGKLEKWWSREPLTTVPLIRYREPVDPAKWSQIPDPVTVEDLGGQFVGGAQCGIDEDTLNTYFDHYDFGRVIKPHLGTLLHDGWREDVQRVADRDLIITSVWGYVPDMPWNGGFGHVQIPRDQHDEILRILGRRFLGYEMGEQDGRYIGSVAPRYRPANRREAKKLFDSWHQRIIDNFYGRMIALASLNFLHDYARLGHRMLGIEASQGLPSDIMEWAFIRGACKQWGALSWNCISVFNRWGYKSYTSTGADHGPDKGPTVELLKRLWYVTYMYGSAINMFESSYFLGEKDEEGFPQLSPIGQCHVDAVRWARDHSDRGVAYTPVAFMLDRDSGWVPPRHLYTGKRYLVWGNLPYSRADCATDAFFRLVWPKYEDCSYYEDERGFLTATPYGDLFDVILSDAPAECLSRYQAIVMIGVVEPLGEGLGKRVAQFVAGGGEILCDASIAAGFGPELTGVEVGTERRAAQRSVSLSTGEVLEEEPYTYLVVRPRGAQALLLSEHGDGLVWQRRSGRGRVVVCCVPSYVSAETEDPQEGVDVPLRHKLLRGFVEVLRPYLKSLGLVKVVGSPVGYLCNVGRDPNRLLVTLFNNAHQPATVEVTAQLGEITSQRPWLGSATLRDGKVCLEIAPLDVAIAELRLRPRG